MRTPLLLAFASSLLSALAHGQMPCGIWDPSLGNPGMTAGGVPATPGVHCSAVYDDGTGPKLYVGGAFGAAGGNPASRIACHNGSTWTALGAGVNGLVRCMAVHDDGSGPALFVGGEFTMAGGVTTKGIAKWDGTNWSAVGGGLEQNGVGYALTVASVGGGNALFLAGSFSKAGGVSARNIARWNGAGWSALGVSPNDGVATTAYAVAPFDDDGPGGNPTKLIVGGTFSSASGVPASRIAAWDGIAWSPLAGGVNNYVHALAVHDEGNGPALFVAGQFTMVNTNLAAYRVARWKGNAWSAMGEGFNGPAVALATHDDGGGMALYAAGFFTAPGTGTGGALKYAARWGVGGWKQLGNGIDSSGGAPTANTLCSYSDSRGPALCVGGIFTSVNAGRPVERIAAWRGKTSALRYCSAKMNSLGCTPEVGWLGAASASASSGFFVKGTKIRNKKSGLLFYSTAGRLSSPYQGGTLCTKSPIKRTPAVNSGGSPAPINDCTGIFQIDVNAFARGSLGGSPAPELSIPGTVVNAQWWGRDPGFPAPNNTTLSDGIEFVMCP